MSELIDTRGLSCPQPVLLFLNALKGDAASSFSVLVDNDASLENVSRAARNRGFSVKTSDEGQGVTRLEIEESS